MGAGASALSRPSQVSGQTAVLKTKDVQQMADALFQFMYKDWDTKEVWEMANKPEDYVIALSDLITNQFHVLGYVTAKNQIGEIYFMKYEGAQGAPGKGRGLAPPGHRYKNENGHDHEALATGVDQQRATAKIIAFYFIRLFQILGALLLVIKDVNLIEPEDESKRVTGRPIINQATLPRFQYGGASEISSAVVLGPYEFLRKYITGFSESQYSSAGITKKPTADGYTYYKVTPSLFFMFKQPSESDVTEAGRISMMRFPDMKFALVVKRGSSFGTMEIPIFVNLVNPDTMSEFKSPELYADPQERADKYPTQVEFKLGKNNRDYETHRVYLQKDRVGYERGYSINYVFRHPTDAAFAASRGIDPNDVKNFGRILELMVLDTAYAMTKQPMTLYVPKEDGESVTKRTTRPGELPDKQTNPVVDEVYQALKAKRTMPHCIARALQLLDLKYINNLSMSDTPETSICKFSVADKKSEVSLADYAPTRSLAQLYGKVNPLDRVKIKATATEFATSMKVLEAFVGSAAAPATRTPLSVHELADATQKTEAESLQKAIDRLKVAFNLDTAGSTVDSFGSMRLAKPVKCAGKTGEEKMTYGLASKLQSVSKQLLAYHVNHTVSIAKFLKTMFNISQRPDGSWKVDGPKGDILFAGFPVLDQLTDTARELLVDYYAGCEGLYQKGLKIWNDEQGDVAVPLYPPPEGGPIQANAALAPAVPPMAPIPAPV
jgi:hypothetical protein